MPLNDKTLKSEFELFYLAELTRKKIKPLSRWEKPMNNSLRKWLRQQGLMVETIRRKTLSGGHIYETIFSTSSHYLNYYYKKFSGSMLDKSRESQKTEGFLFGYPACCAEQFIQKPYIHNGLDKSDQQLLFHWACPGCRITPELLSYYRPIFRETQEWYRHLFNKSPGTNLRTAQKFAWAATIALMLSTSSLKAHSPADSSHFIPVVNDTDLDGLNDCEEVYLGSNFYNSTTLNGVNDNTYWTQFFKVMIDSLPTTPQTDTPYKIENYALGVEICQKCGASINMGFVQMVNPQGNLQIDIPFMGLHFLENNCFSFDGSIHSGRIDIDLLKKILFAFDTAHQLPVVGDSDQDGLTDAEEDSLYLNANNPDTDGDGVPDGAQVAEQLIRLFPKLKEQPDSIHTRIEYQPLWGLENCTICGGTFNMGQVVFRNPENGQTYFLHFNGLHALAHGSFAYDGTTFPNQRADAVKLYRTMKTHQLHILDDSDNDGLTDAEENHFGYDPNQPDSNGDGIYDGMDLCLSMVSVLDSLPTSPMPMEPYVIHHPTYGFYNCLLCGDPVNMGFLELVNPLINCPPMQITYYAYHFLKKGSFAFEGRIDGGQWFEGRIDPLTLSDYLGFPSEITPPLARLVKGFDLQPNYPNPFNPVTRIEYKLEKKESVKIEVFNILGEMVEELVNQNQTAGEYYVDFNAGNLSSGIYFYRMSAGKFIKVRKMFLIR